MTRVYVADTLPQERSALRLMLQDLQMEVVGEAADWPTTLSTAPLSKLDMLLLDWSLLPKHKSSQALLDLRMACPGTIVVVLISHLDAREQAALSTGADAFISKSDSAERVADHLRLAAESIHP